MLKYCCKVQHDAVHVLLMTTSGMGLGTGMIWSPGGQKFVGNSLPSNYLRDMHPNHSQTPALRLDHRSPLACGALFVNYLLNPIQMISGCRSRTGDVNRSPTSQKDASHASAKFAVTSAVNLIWTNLHSHGNSHLSPKTSGQNSH
jgi:hypothetical protein